jgi:hypothetical protein
MLARRIARVAVLAALAAGPARAAEPDPHLRPLLPLLNKTWRGQVGGGAGGKAPAFDVQQWELALNGRAVRVLHSVNDGDYGGESLIFWDAEKQSLIFYYFTTGGFYTTGTATTEDGALVTLELVKGSAGGITEVKGITRVLPDGRLHVKTEYRKNGAWVPGREAHYSEAPGAQIRFK